MMQTMTRGNESSAATGYLLVAFELSQRWWKVGFTTGMGHRVRTRRIAAGALEPLAQGIADAKKRFGLAAEARVRPDHPLRAIRAMTDQVLRELSPRFTKMYSDIGRPSIPPEQLLRALLLQGLYTIRSERLLMEEIDYSILFRWFIGLSLDEPIWSPTSFSKNRDRLLTADVASAFFDAVVMQARDAGLMSDEHFTVDGTVLEAWASLKSIQRKDASPTLPPDDPTVSFHGETRRNDTHQSRTDPDAQLYRKGQGKEAKLAYLGHVLLDNRHGLVANVCATAATGTGEWEAALLMLEQAAQATTVGGDKHFDVARFVTPARHLGITPHVAQKDDAERHRRADHAACRLRGQSTAPETRGRNLRLDEDDRAAAEGAPSRRAARRMDLHLHRRRLQPGPAAHPPRRSGLSRRADDQDL